MSSDFYSPARIVLLLAGSCATLAGYVSAAPPAVDGVDTAEALSPVVVTATRIAQASIDLPVSVDRIGHERLRAGQLQVNLSESLIAVPGLSVQSRQNYAQDLQLSIRGFGARSSFGVRGVRLYADGIPGTMPDGQGQFSQFDLGSAERVEVLRGPFSALYGNSSGGVIAIFTQDGAPGAAIDAFAAAGSLSTQRYALKAAGESGRINFVADAAHFETDGYRNHSAAERNNFNAKLRIQTGEGSDLTLVANAVQTPEVQDPLGLTRAQFVAGPTQAGANALLYNTRKSLNQEQAGAFYRRKIGADAELAASLYVGHRATTQYQAILRTAEARPTHPGGVIDLGRNFWGMDVHIQDQRELAGTPLLFTLGVNYDDLQEARRGYLNFDGAEVGVKGDLRRDDANHVYDFDQYFQVQWDPNARWRLLAGVRNSVVDVTSRSHLAVLSGAKTGVRYSAVNPVAGITYRLAPSLNLYAAYGRGFETPTLNDLAYRSTDGSIPGLNLGLRPARSDNNEVGIKAGNAHVRANLAAFYVKTENELAVLANSGGRSVFQNIGQTTRRGIELGIDAIFSRGFSARAAYTHIRAVTANSYATCVGLPCSPVSVNAGSYLPAVPMNSLYAGVSWAYAPLGLTATLEAQSRSQIFVDDRNTDSASGYWAENFRIGVEQMTPRWKFSEFVRVDNLADRSYVGSVIVNEGNSRFFEPAPGRTYYVMFNVAHRS